MDRHGGAPALPARRPPDPRLPPPLPLPHLLAVLPLEQTGMQISIYRVGKEVGPRLREHFRQIEVEEVLASNSRNKSHQTWGKFQARPCKECFRERGAKLRGYFLRNHM